MLVEVVVEVVGEVVVVVVGLLVVVVVEVGMVVVVVATGLLEDSEDDMVGEADCCSAKRAAQKQY